MRNRIKEYRARVNVTQAELAAMVGVRRETVLYLEKGTYNPSLSLAARVAHVLGATIEELFIFEESELRTDMT